MWYCCILLVGWYFVLFTLVLERKKYLWQYQSWFLVGFFIEWAYSEKWKGARIGKQQGNKWKIYNIVPRHIQLLKKRSVQLLHLLCRYHLSNTLVGESDMFYTGSWSTRCTSDVKTILTYDQILIRGGYHIAETY